MTLITTEDSNILCYSQDRMIIAQIIPAIMYGDIAIHPKAIDIQSADNVVRFRGRDVGKIDVIALGPDETYISARMVFHADPTSLSIYRMFKSGILSSFVIRLNLDEIKSVAGDKRFPINCQRFAYEASLQSVDIDPFAPI